ncbi:MAG: FHA domain-containing protein [Syntrophales bacterium]|jgi:hypothetical protein
MVDQVQILSALKAAIEKYRWSHYVFAEYDIAMRRVHYSEAMCCFLTLWLVDQLTKWISEKEYRLQAQLKISFIQDDNIRKEFEVRRSSKYSTAKAWLEDHDSEARYDIIEGGVILGRDPTCDFHISDATVSSIHCMIQYAGSRYVITDFDSRNGIRINDRKMAGTAPLDDGDVITIGHKKFRFRIAAVRILG